MRFIWKSLCSFSSLVLQAVSSQLGCGTATAERPWINKGVLQCLLLFYSYRETEQGAKNECKQCCCRALSSELHPQTSTQLWAQCYMEQRMQKSASQSSATMEKIRKKHPAVSLLPRVCFAEIRNEVCSRPGSFTDTQSSSKGNPQLQEFSLPLTAGPAGCSACRADRHLYSGGTLLKI